MKNTVAHMIKARGAPVQMQLYRIVIILTWEETQRCYI